MSSVSNDGEGSIKPVKRCTVQLDNHLRIIYNWVAPEVLFGKPFSCLSDIYSLCAVLWEAAKGTFASFSVFFRTARLILLML